MPLFIVGVVVSSLVRVVVVGCLLCVACCSVPFFLFNVFPFGRWSLFRCLSYIVCCLRFVAHCCCLVLFVLLVVWCCWLLCVVCWCCLVLVFMVAVACWVFEFVVCCLLLFVVCCALLLVVRCCSWFVVDCCALYILFVC